MSKLCPKCNKELNCNVKFCDNCGTFILNKKKAKPVFLLGILSIVLSVICFLVVIYHTVTYVGGVRVEYWGDSELILKEHLTKGIMNILTWLGIILFILAIACFIVGFINKKNNKDIE